jgi:alpha-glucosidase
MSAKELLEVAHTFRKHNIPADVLYCDIDYMEGYKIFTWNEKTFANPKALLDELKSAWVLNWSPLLILALRLKKAINNMMKAWPIGYFATYPDGEEYTGEVWPGRCHFPDFFKPEVREWWGKSFSALTKPGVIRLLERYERACRLGAKHPEHCKIW